MNYEKLVYRIRKIVRTVLKLRTHYYSSTGLLSRNELLILRQSVYKWAIEHGIAKEQARTVLPEGLTKTRLYMHGTVRSWIHYIDVRTTPGTQKEHMDIATSLCLCD